MKKKGFTLVELIATIVVLAVISMIALPIVNVTIKNNKEKLYKSQIKEIEEATEKWAYSNIDMLPGEGETITITILELKKAGFLPLDIRDPRSSELLPNDMEVTITFNNNVYTYNVNEESGTNITSEFNENSPILILNGNPLEYIEVGSIYNEIGAKAKDKNGNEISFSTMFQYDGVEIPSIDTNEFKTYTVVYSATSEINGKRYTSTVTRTVIVRDTTAPNLVLPGKTNISLTSASSYNVLEGVEATDNSGEVINVTFNGFDSSLGQKIVSYTACDSHNNCVTKKRIINVLSDEAINPSISFEIQPNTMILKPDGNFSDSNLTYTWYKDGVPVSSSKTYNLVSTGTYQLEVKVNNITKKSSELEVLDYQLKYDKVLFVAKKDDNCVLRRNGSYEIEEFEYNDKCTMTTALNMVKNGYLEYKDNTNFSQMIYDSEEDALYITNTQSIYTGDYIPVDYNRVYNQSVEMKSESTSFKHYVGFASYDIDKRLILAPNIMFVNDTLTYLAKDLNNGDTIVYLNDISNFENVETTPNYRLGLIFWNYKDSTGYVYPELSYSRNNWKNLYSYDAIDKENNTIILNQPWSYGTYITGTKLSQSNDGIYQNYGLIYSNYAPNIYTTYTNTFTDWSYPSDNNLQKFRYGTKYIKFLLAHNNNNSNPNTSYIKNIVITEE